MKFHLKRHVLFVVLMATSVLTTRADDRAALLALGRIEKAPSIHPAEGFAEDGGVRPIFFDALPYRGKPTRVFAWLGVPAKATSQAKAPGIVLVHGGGGTAFKEWVKRWNAQGFAAIAIATEGQTEARKQSDVRGDNWLRHEWAGPSRDNIFGDTAEPLPDQWMYHAVADTLLARALLTSLPEVDGAKTGLMGVSWGGIITSIVMGLEPRFAFAIPTYGCGRLHEIEEKRWGSLKDNATYRELWDAGLRMENARMPALWLTRMLDGLAITSQAATYRAAPGPRMVAIWPDGAHSHAAAWTAPDSYAFAKAIVTTGKPWARMVAFTRKQGQARAEFESDRAAKGAQLVFTADTGHTMLRKWQRTPAKLVSDGKHIHVSAPLPPGVTTCYFHLDCDGLTLCSDLQTITTP